MQKRFVGEQELLEEAYRLARRIADSGWRPSCLVGLWPAGAVVGVYVQECLQHLGIACRHNALRLSAEAPAAADPGIGWLEDVLAADDRLLIVDAVYGSGRSTGALRGMLAARLGARMPADVRIAAIWHRRADGVPDFTLHASADRLVMPHELVGLTPAEMAAHRPLAAALLAGLERG